MMRTTCTLFLCLCFWAGHAQEMLGISNSNYGGTNNLMLNPSAVVNPYLKWDINLITLGVHLDNNYLYIPNTSLTKLPKTLSDAAANDQSPLVQRYLQSRNKQGYMSLLVKGPSVMFNYKKKHGFGLHTAIRGNASVRCVDAGLADLIYTSTVQGEFLPDPGLLSIPRFRVNAMSWGEIGLTYGTILAEDRSYMVKAGGTMKFLLGTVGGYLQNRGSSLAVVQDEDGPIPYPALNFALGYTNPVNENYPLGFRLINGKGIGMDMGVSYEYKDNMRSRYSDLAKKGRSIEYTWKVGASLLDVGGIYFNRSGYKVAINEAYTNDSILDAQTEESVLQTINPQPGDFYMALPTGVSVQAGYHVTDLFFVNATWVQRVPHLTHGVDRENLLSVTPRYETRHFEVALPVVLYEYRDPRIGLAARFGSFVIGSDKIGSLFGSHNMTGMDFYMSIKISGDYLAKDKDKAPKGTPVNSRRGRAATLIPGKRWKCFEW